MNNYLMSLPSFDNRAREQKQQASKPNVVQPFQNHNNGSSNNFFLSKSVSSQSIHPKQQPHSNMQHLAYHEQNSFRPVQPVPQQPGQMMSRSSSSSYIPMYAMVVPYGSQNASYRGDYNSSQLPNMNNQMSQPQPPPVFQRGLQKSFSSGSAFMKPRQDQHPATYLVDNSDNGKKCISEFWSDNVNNSSNGKHFKVGWNYDKIISGSRDDMRQIGLPEGSKTSNHLKDIPMGAVPAKIQANTQLIRDMANNKAGFKSTASQIDIKGRSNQNHQLQRLISNAPVPAISTATPHSSLSKSSSFSNITSQMPAVKVTEISKPLYRVQDSNPGLKKSSSSASIYSINNNNSSKQVPSFINLPPPPPPPLQHTPSLQQQQQQHQVQQQPPQVPQRQYHLASHHHHNHHVHNNQPVVQNATAPLAKSDSKNFLNQSANANQSTKNNFFAAVNTTTTNAPSSNSQQKNCSNNNNNGVKKVDVVPSTTTTSTISSSSSASKPKASDKVKQISVAGSKITPTCAENFFVKQAIPQANKVVINYPPFTKTSAVPIPIDGRLPSALPSKNGTHQEAAKQPAKPKPPIVEPFPAKAKVQEDKNKGLQKTTGIEINKPSHSVKPINQRSKQEEEKRKNDLAISLENSITELLKFDVQCAGDSKSSVKVPAGPTLYPRVKNLSYSDLLLKASKNNQNCMITSGNLLNLNKNNILPLTTTTKYLLPTSSSFSIHKKDGTTAVGNLLNKKDDLQKVKQDLYNSHELMKQNKLKNKDFVKNFNNLPSPFCTPSTSAKNVTTNVEQNVIEKLNLIKQQQQRQLNQNNQHYPLAASSSIGWFPSALQQHQNEDNLNGAVQNFPLTKKLSFNQKLYRPFENTVQKSSTSSSLVLGPHHQLIAPHSPNVTPSLEVDTQLLIVWRVVVHNACAFA